MGGVDDAEADGAAGAGGWFCCDLNVAGEQGEDGHEALGGEIRRVEVSQPRWLGLVDGEALRGGGLGQAMRADVFADTCRKSEGEFCCVVDVGG